MGSSGVVVWAEQDATQPGPAAAATPSWLAQWHLKGRLKEEIAYRLSTPDQLTKLKTIGWLEGRYDFSPAVHFKLAGRGWYDGVYDLAAQYPASVAHDQEVDLDLRQALVSVSTGGLDVRVGRQQIVWGEALGTFVTDVINPKDFREFVLPELSEIRLPLWALNLTYTFGKALVLEGVWTPEVRVNTFPKPGAEFAFFRPTLPPNVRLQAEEKPAMTLGHSQGGVRMSYLLSGWDIALFYYDAFDPTPVFFRRQSGVLSNGVPMVALTPRHARIHMLGGTLGKSLEPVVVRAELLYTLGKHFSTTARSATDGVARSDTLDYLLSLDYTLFGALDTTWQFTQKILTGATDVSHLGGVQGRMTSTFTLRLATGLFNNTLNPSALIAVGVNRGDYRLSPRLDYRLTGALTLTLGADIFAGPRSTLYGQFASKDRLYSELEYHF
jgi:hypothetical protein